jgi:hypothetical protein
LFAERILEDNGFPITPQNVLALYRQIGFMTMIKSGQIFDILGQPSGADDFAKSHEFRPTDDPATWVQRILDDLCAVDPVVAEGLQDWPERVRGMLDRSAGNPGSFLGGDRSVPLPFS